MKDEKLDLINKRRVSLRRKIAVAGGVATAIAYFVPFIIMATLLDMTDFGGMFTITLGLTILVLIMSWIAYESNGFLDFLLGIIDFTKRRKISKEYKIDTPSRYKFLKLSEIFFSAKTQEEIFLPTMADWDDEIYKALNKTKDARLFMINMRYTYAFLAAMWQKSPIGDLIEFVVKIAKG